MSHRYIAIKQPRLFILRELINLTQQNLNCYLSYDDEWNHDDILTINFTDDVDDYYIKEIIDLICDNKDRVYFLKGVFYSNYEIIVYTIEELKIIKKELMNKSFIDNCPGQLLDIFKKIASSKDEDVLNQCINQIHSISYDVNLNNIFEFK